MSRFWSYFLFINVLLYSTPLSQLLQAPMLYVHFVDHEKRQPDITFADFLFMHYWGDDLNDNDSEEDQKLPFKNATGSSIGYVFVEHRTFSVSLSRTFEETIKYILPDASSLPENPNSSLFRPPRQVATLA